MNTRRRIHATGSPQSTYVHGSFEWNIYTLYYLLCYVYITCKGGGVSSVFVIVAQGDQGQLGLVFDWHTMLHLQIYFKGHTGESSVPGRERLYLLCK